VFTAIRSALTDDGRFAFETRNPPAQAWEHRPTDYTAEVTDADGGIVRCGSETWAPVERGIVRGSGTYTSPGWDRPLVRWSMPRFLDAATLSSFLPDAGLTIEEQFGDWTGQPLTDASPEIITCARKG
jgi:hypothetical protein